MSYKAKKRDDDEAVSEGEERPKKFSKPSASSTVGKDSDETDQIVIGELSRNRKVTVRKWQGKIVLDIREFYLKDGNEFPGKKGISLGMDQWQILRDHLDEIDDEVTPN